MKASGCALRGARVDRSTRWIEKCICWRIWGVDLGVGSRIALVPVVVEILQRPCAAHVVKQATNRQCNIGMKLALRIGPLFVVGIIYMLHDLGFRNVVVFKQLNKRMDHHPINVVIIGSRLLVLSEETVLLFALLERAVVGGVLVSLLQQVVHFCERLEVQLGLTVLDMESDHSLQNWIKFVGVEIVLHLDGGPGGAYAEESDWSERRNMHHQKELS